MKTLQMAAVPETKMPDVLHLQLAAQDQLVKLSWSTLESQSGYVTPFGVYCVAQTRLKDAAQGVRATLRDIADEYRSSNANYKTHFPTLARAGERLKNAVFPRDSETAQDVLAYVASRGRSSSLNVTTDATVQVPWGFVYLGDPKKPPPLTETIADFADFLSVAFRIRIRYSLVSGSPLTRPISRQRVKTLLALHESRFENAKQVLFSDVDDEPVAPGHAKNITQKMKRLLEHDVGWTVNWDECHEKWKSIEQSDSVFYIFAHSDGKTLSLKDTEELEKNEKFKYELQADGFENYFGKQKQDTSQTLCFINGCRTADGEWDNGFLSVTSAHGFQGFIGSEAEISNVWATRYAVEFLYRLIEEGKSVDEAYEELRELCFPMSLWYSCYAYPHFRVSPE